MKRRNETGSARCERISLQPKRHSPNCRKKQKNLESDLAAADLYTPGRKADLGRLLLEKKDIDHRYAEQEEIWIRLYERMESAGQ